jgi:plasmid stabilization system protein ParE
MGAKIFIAPSARNDLRDIVAFAALHDPDAAERLGFALIARAESLADFPKRGRVVPEYGNPQLRELLHLSYRVIYRLNESKQSVEVVRFWHAARGFPQLPLGE